MKEKYHYRQCKLHRRRGKSKNIVDVETCHSVVFYLSKTDGSYRHYAIFQLLYHIQACQSTRNTSPRTTSERIIVNTFAPQTEKR